MRFTSVQDIASLGTILFVGAHPDDETFLCGGILAAACQAGQRVVCVTATHGEAGQDAIDSPAGMLGSVRKQELNAALNILGITEHHWLHYNDGACEGADPAEALRVLGELITGVRPDTVLTFGPDGLTGHEDHKAVSAWTTRALREAASSADLFHKVEAKELYEPYLVPIDTAITMYFKTDNPPVVPARDCDIHITLTPALTECKLQALAAMPTQTKQLFEQFPHDFLAKALGVEAFVRTQY